MAAERPSVLSVCFHNAGRSQMAAGFLQHLAGERVEVPPAGSQPADEVNPVAVQAMSEKGIDISRGVPQLFADSALRVADVGITAGTVLPARGQGRDHQTGADQNQCSRTETLGERLRP